MANQQSPPPASIWLKLWLVFSGIGLLTFAILKGPGCLSEIAAIADMKTGPTPIVTAEPTPPTAQEVTECKTKWTSKQGWAECACSKCFQPFKSCDADLACKLHLAGSDNLNDPRNAGSKAIYDAFFDCTYRNCP
jgi:hypothetical protein